MLLAIDGLVVDRVLIDESGRRVVHCSTDPQLAGRCPACGASVDVAEGAGDDPPAGCADRPGSASVVVAQTEMALPGAGV